MKSVRSISCQRYFKTNWFCVITWKQTLIYNNASQSVNDLPLCKYLDTLHCVLCFSPTHTLPCKIPQAKQCEHGKAKEWAIEWYTWVLSLTWAPSLSGCSSSSSASDAPRWPENTERSLALNRSDGGLQPARAADPAENHTHLSRLIAPQDGEAQGDIYTSRGHNIPCFYPSGEAKSGFNAKREVCLGVIGLTLICSIQFLFSSFLIIAAIFTVIRRKTPNIILLQDPTRRVVIWNNCLKTISAKHLLSVESFHLV